MWLCVCEIFYITFRWFLPLAPREENNQPSSIRVGNERKFITKLSIYSMPKKQHTQFPSNSKILLFLVLWNSPFPFFFDCFLLLSLLRYKIDYIIYTYKMYIIWYCIELWNSYIRWRNETTSRTESPVHVSTQSTALFVRLQTVIFDCI